jgi:hypothetical protein
VPYTIHRPIAQPLDIAVPDPSRGDRVSPPRTLLD